MLIGLFFILFFVACLYCVMRDASVVPYLLLIGFLQDPARKLIAGEPVYMTVLVGVVMGCVVLRKIVLNPVSLSEPFTRWSNSILLPLSLYLLVLLLQFVHALLRYDSFFIPALGSIFYLAPLLAISVGYSQFPSFERMRTFLTIFCGLAVLVSLTVILSFNNVQSDLFGEVGSGLVIYDQGVVLKAYSGLMRSSEIASWHMGACVCFLVILLVDKNSLPSLLIVLALAALIISAIILTGRRKMLVQILVFSALYLPMLRYYQGRLKTDYFIGIILIVVLGWFSSELIFTSMTFSEFELYLRRGSSVFGDVSDRFEQLGVGSINWAYQRFGIFGGGLGVAAQGAQHFGGSLAAGAGEGGIGKLVAEIGLISLLLVVWLLYAIGDHINSCIKLVAQKLPNKLPIVIGVFCFLAANAPTFVVASQVYGDLFILTVSGLLLGFLFAIPNQVVGQLRQHFYLSPEAESRA